jgi:AcrR family transcriptional regulator
LKKQNKDARMAEIEATAYNLLAQQGYENISMLKIAKAAKASNETLYNWYGDKKGLFAAMIRKNASQTADEIEAALARSDDAEPALRVAAQTLLTMLTSDNAIALNRAAAGDPTGELGEVLNKEGRQSVAPKFLPLLTQLSTTSTAERALYVFLSVLIGDWQIRRVIGVMSQPTAAEITARVEMALSTLKQLT